MLLDNGSLVSVIMPVYNCEKYVDMAIDSIIDQTYQNWELLICNDGSSDNTRNIINAFAKKDQRIKVFHNQSNCGNIVTTNKLFKLTAGTYITIQDADDWSHPDRILLQLEKMKRNNLLACGTQCFNSTENGQIYSQTDYPSDYTTILKSTPGNFPVVCASIMIHKEVYNAIGGYEPYFNRLGGADLYWFSKIIEKYKFENINLPLYYYRRTRESFSRTIKSEKQLIIIDIIAYLIEQRRNIGLDDLERKDFVSLENKINSLLSDRRFISEKYRKQAVHAVDQGNLILGYNNIVKSLQKMPDHLITYRSLAYLIKKIFKEGFLKIQVFSRKELRVTVCRFKFQNVKIMLQVAIISDDPGRGGTYRVATDIAQGLDKSIFKVNHYFLCDKPENPPEGVFLGKPPISIDYSLKSYLRLAFFTKKYEKYFPPLNNALKEYQPDIIHFHTHSTLIPLMHGVKKTVPSAKLMYTDHSQRIRQGELSKLKQYLMSIVYRRLFRLAKIVFVSKYAYQTALKLRYGNNIKDLVLVNSVDPEKFRPLKVASNENIKVVYISRIHPAKGHKILLEAWQQLPQNNNLSLHFYGVEADGGVIATCIQKEVYINSISYEGVTKTPASVLQGAQIGAFPSYREGLPLALLEMMACGLPVVASDIPEIQSIITHGKNGLLFKCGDKSDLANKLQQLINDESLREYLGKEARKTVEKSYSEPISRKYSNLYQALASVDK